MNDKDVDPDQRADEDLPQLDSDFQAIGSALRILQFNVEGLSAANRKRKFVSVITEKNVDIICL